MAEDLAEDFVRLSNRCLGTDTAAEPGLDHVERRFDVAPTVVVAQKLLAVVHVV